MTWLEPLHQDERELVLTELEETPKVDNRFRNLLGDEAWNRLPEAIKRRFSRHIEGGKSVVYKGVITALEFSPLGKFLAQACRLIGAPLPYETQPNGTPAIVTVTEDKAGTGQFWSRTYGRENGFPQVIHSSKRFQGKTGLEEYIGCGIVMDSIVTATENAMVFSSKGFHIQLGPVNIPLPRFIHPGQVKVTHEEQGDGYFAFVLELTHPMFGRLLYQRGIFCEHEMVVQ